MTVAAPDRIRGPGQPASGEEFLVETFLFEAMLEACAQVAGKRFSDIVDDHGRQYVDLVMEGGGNVLFQKVYSDRR